MATLEIVIGNKNYSSWSLRGWLMVKATGAPFRERRILLDVPDTAARIRQVSPAGRVPILIADGLKVHDTLAIGEYLNECFPAAGLWPAAPEARAVARAVSAEMHAGFEALRQAMPMNCRARKPGLDARPEALADIARITEIWTDCRARFGAGGPFLFGAFGIADCMYAPVASRFATYDVALSALAAAYRDAVLAHPAMADWLAGAAAEPEVIAAEEITE